MNLDKIKAIFAGEQPLPQPTAEEERQAAIVCAEWEAHSLECERIEREVPANERHTAFAALDARFKAAGVIDPTFRG